MEKYFNVRVYGLLIKDGKLLVSDEWSAGTFMTKLPGGGLEFGEGPAECLVREFEEEANLQVRIVRHFYTTDFFVLSQFNSKGQLISIYYVVDTADDLTNLPTVAQAFTGVTAQEDSQALRWIPLSQVSEESFTLPVDKVVGRMLAAELANL